MNRILTQFLLLTLIFSYSCTIQKRHFRSGWHVSFNQKLSSSEIEQKKTQEALSLDTVNFKDENNNLIKKVLVDKELKIERNLITQNKASIYEKESPRKINVNNKELLQTSSKKNINTRESKIKKAVSKSTTDEFEDKGPLFPRILGGFFGVLLALLALIPLLLIVFFILDESISSLTFKVKESDNYFVTAFKKSYHAVFRVGLLIFITMLVFGVAALIILAGYNLLGVFGLILTIILAILIILLFALIWRWLLDFLMFNE